MASKNETRSTIGRLDKAMKAGEASKEELTWHSPKDTPFHVAGFGWFEKERVYRRLPRKPAHEIREPVDYLANYTAGGQIRFQTDSPVLSIKVKLLEKASMVHMPATGQCGFDCYIGPAGRQLYYSTTKYDITKAEYEIVMFDFPESELRNITLFFPLYNGVEEVLVGLVPEAKIMPPQLFASDRPVIVYGTSITQGGCASRPGMAYTNILSRKLNIEFINLGFSGNGKGDPEVAKIITDIPNPACFVLDYESNCSEEGRLEETLPEFIRILREAHPEVPILVISRIRYAAENFDEVLNKKRIERMEFQKQTVEELWQKGDRFIFFKDGSDLLGNLFHEAAVDGCHPTDLGFMCMADALLPVFEKVLESV